MTLKKPWSRESLAANGALAGLVVCPEVHGKGWHGDVDLATDGALFGLLIVQRPLMREKRDGKISGNRRSL